MEVGGGISAALLAAHWPVTSLLALSNFNDQPGIKAFAEFTWVTALIGEHPRFADSVVHVVMGMAVNPERNAALLDQPIQPGSERWIERAVCMVRRFRARARRVVCHHNGARRVASGQRALQPG